MCFCYPLPHSYHLLLCFYLLNLQAVGLSCEVLSSLVLNLERSPQSQHPNILYHIGEDQPKHNAWWHNLSPLGTNSHFRTLLSRRCHPTRYQASHPDLQDESHGQSTC